MIESQKNKLVTSLQKLAESGLLAGDAEGLMMDVAMDSPGIQANINTEPLKELFLGKKHPMIPFISDNETKFFIVRAPTEDYLLLGAK